MVPKSLNGRGVYSHIYITGTQERTPVHHWSMPNHHTSMYLGCIAVKAFDYKIYVTAGNITFGILYKYYKSLPLELFRALEVGA